MKILVILITSTCLWCAAVGITNLILGSPASVSAHGRVVLTSSCRAVVANAMTSVSSQKGRVAIHAKRSTVSQIGNKMIPLYGFSGLAGCKQDYKCDCSLCGGNQDNWTTFSETQKMVKAIILKAQCEAELSATRQPFQRK